MTYDKKIATVVLIGSMLSGCSTPGVKQVACIAAGTLIAGAAARYGTDDNDPATAGAAVLGGLIGLSLCKEEPEPPKVTPKPKPAPKPVPKPLPKPDPDSDGDGVTDSRDDCPSTTLGTPVDERGCPEIPNLQGVHFEFDRDVLTPEAREILQVAVEALRSNPHVRVEIVGHTDSIGTTLYNLNLSERRAVSARRYLEDSGVAAERITASGKGESEPLESNNTKAGRQKNRRVEITARPIH